MIKINLAIKKQSIFSDAKIRSSANVKDNILDFGEELKALPLIKIIFCLIIGFGANYALQIYQSKVIELLDKKLDVIEVEKTKLQKQIVEYKNFESDKARLEADETLLKTKVTSIEILLNGRKDIYQFEKKLAAIVPSQVWINKFSLLKDNISINGEATDFDQVSDFMSNLRQLAFLQNIKLQKTEQAKNPSGVSGVSFSISAGHNFYDYKKGKTE